MGREIIGCIGLSLAMACSGDGGSSSDGGSACADTQSDPGNCGQCGHVCTAEQAPVACVLGHCARGPCFPGWYDIDGSAANGCEARCEGTTCTTGTGSSAQSRTFSAPPVPETGVVASALSNSGPADPGAAEQSTHGILGEATPLPWHDPHLSKSAFISNQNAEVENFVGYDALLH